MLLFKGGQPVAQKVGAAPRSQIQQWLESNLVSTQSQAG
jgi:thioredoxin 1